MPTHVACWWMRIFGLLLGFGAGYWLRAWLAGKDRKGGD